MELQCSKCGMRMEPAWRFCPDCGSANRQAILNRQIQKQAAPEERERAPVQGTFGGLLFGMLAVPILVIVGTMLCLTGLGAIVGIPMIIAAVFSPLLGPMIGLGAVKGKCPWCGVQVSSVANAKDFDCHGCGKRIAIKHREFVTAG